MSTDKKERPSITKNRSGINRLKAYRLSRDVTFASYSGELRTTRGSTSKTTMTGRINQTFSKLRRGSIRTATLVSNAAARRRSKMKYKRTWNNIYRIGGRASFAEGGTVMAPLEPENVDETLFDKIQASLFKQNISKKRYKDIIRTAHCVTIESFNENNEVETCTASEEITTSHEPDRETRDMSRMVLIIEKLAIFFCETCDGEDAEEDTKEMCGKIVQHANEFIDRYKNGEIEKIDFNLLRLFEELDNYYATLLIEKIRCVLNFLHLSVVIFAMEELHSKLGLGIEHIRKDVEWRINVKLTDRVIEISHTRREGVLKPKGQNNYWEISYSLAMSFDPKMNKFFSVGLAVNDLTLDDEIDDQLAAELKSKFGNGNYKIC